MSSVWTLNLRNNALTVIWSSPALTIKDRDFYEILEQLLTALISIMWQLSAAHHWKTSYILSKSARLNIDFQKTFSGNKTQCSVSSKPLSLSFTVQPCLQICIREKMYPLCLSVCPNNLKQAVPWTVISDLTEIEVPWRRKWQNEDFENLVSIQLTVRLLQESFSRFHSS